MSQFSFFFYRRITTFLTLAIMASGAGMLALPEPAVTEMAPRRSARVVPREYAPVTWRRQDANAEWVQLGGNPQRTGYVATELADRWQFLWVWNGPPPGSDGGPAASHLKLPQGVQPVFGDGKMYVGHSDGRVRAVRADTGVEVWNTRVGGEVLNTAAYDAATGSVFVASTNGRLFRLRAGDGAITGSFNAGASIVMAPLLVGTTVYIGATNGRMYAVNTSTLKQRWVYNAGAELRASAAYSSQFGGLIIFPAEDAFVHAVQATNGRRRWRVAVNTYRDPKRGNRAFNDTFPVVAETNGVVIIRSYFDWEKTWQPAGGAPATVAELRSFLAANPAYQSFHVLNLADGRPRFVAPVLGGGIGNGGDYYSVPPQVTIRRLPDGGEIAYLFWRTRQSCGEYCDGREDTTLGEMDLRTGAVRFVEDHKNQGTMRFPTDEQGALSMAGDVLFHAHWMLMGAIRITDRSPGLGDTYANPIRSRELTPVLNTIESGTCPQRAADERFCPNATTPAEGEGFMQDPGFYIYHYDRNVYDQYFTTPVRSVVIHDGVIYWRSVDGAIIALRGR